MDPVQRSSEGDREQEHRLIFRLWPIPHPNYRPYGLVRREIYDLCLFRASEIAGFVRNRLTGAGAQRPLRKSPGRYVERQARGNRASED